MTKGKEYLFRTCFTDDQQGAVAARFVQSRADPKVRDSGEVPDISRYELQAVQERRRCDLEVGISEAPARS